MRRRLERKNGRRGMLTEGLGRGRSRRSKDRKVNAEGRIVLRYLDEKGWMITNGREEEGEEWTYVGERGKSVIDYVIGNQEATEEIVVMKVGSRGESDHMPLEIDIEGPEIRRGEEREVEEKEKREWTSESVGR
jgi:hypothetical protein